MSPSAKAVRSVAVLAAAGLAVACAWWGWTGHGIYHPDEIYQALEPAHELVYGYGLTSWEWRVGARNYALPGLLSAGFGLSTLLGLDRSPLHIAPVTALVSLLTGATALGIYRLSRAIGADRGPAIIGVFLFAGSPLAVYFGHRPFAEVVSAPFVTWGLALVAASAGTDQSPPHRWRIGFVAGASLLGFAVLLRLQNAAFAAVLLAVYRWEGRQRAYRAALDVLVVWALIYGAVDWIAWGLPYQSVGAYLHFNLGLGGTTAYYGSSAFGAYAAAIFSSAGPVAAATVFGAVFGIRRAPRLTIVAGAFLLLHQLFPHRDLRFIYPAWPAVCAVAGLGFGWLSRRDRALRGVVCTVLAVGCIGFTVWKLPRLTFGDLRQAETLGVRPARSAHGLHGDVNRVLARAGRLPELCGLKLHRILAVETGGLTYLHRDVPVYHPLQPAPSEAHYNYTVARDSAVEGRGSEEIDRVRRMGETSLVRTGGTSCETDLDYRPRIDRPAKLSKGGDADSPRVSSTRRRRAAAPGS